MTRLLLILSAASALLLGCTNQNEMNNLSLAQQCLDQVPQSDPTQANNCMSYISSYTDQRAMVLQCSIDLMAGGITTDQIATALETLTGSGGQPAAYAALLAFRYPANLATAYSNATTAQGICAQGGDLGLEYVANMAVVGSLANKVAGGIDFTSTATIETSINNVIANCNTTPSNCDPSVLAPIAVSTATDYCSNATANQSVCSAVSSAVQQYGGNSSTLTQALLCKMQGKTFTAGPPATCS